MLNKLSNKEIAMSKVGKTLGVIAVGAAVIGLAAYVAKKVKEIEDFDIDDFDDEDEKDESEGYEFEDDDIAKEFDENTGFDTPVDSSFEAETEVEVSDDTEDVWGDDTEVASEEEESFTADFMEDNQEDVSLFKEVCGVSRTEAIEKIISADTEVGYTVSDLEAMSDDALADVYSKTCL